MKSLLSRHAALGGLFVAVGLLSLGATLPRQERTAVGVRVGVFDSRALPIAFASSEVFRGQQAELRAEHERAKAAGDPKRAAELAQAGQARQARMHKQTFSTAPVDDILAEIAGELPGIAEKAGVDLIVSKWSVAYQRHGIELVDVTQRLVEVFEPGEKALRNIAQLRDREPLPLYETDWDAVERSH